MFKTEIIKTIDEIIAKINAGETILFCGAGISFHSGIPVVYQLMSKVIGKLGFDEHEKERLLKAFPSFEGFMQLLLENTGNNLLFDAFDPHGIGELVCQDHKRYANVNHFVIANLIKAGKVKTVVTTNFDRLIEEELQCGEPRWKENNDYDVFYLEQTKGDIPGYSDIVWGRHPDRPRIIKIHGSMHARDELAITLARVANETFSSTRASVIEHVFASDVHRQVLILGYSCSDVFDITPSIERINERSRIRVVLVEHLSGQDEAQSRAEDIRKKQDKNPFKKFFNGERLYYNTDMLIQLLAKKTLGVDIHETYRSPYKWQSAVNMWHHTLLEFEKDAAIAGLRGRILQYTGQTSEAVDEFKKALSDKPEPEESAFIEDCWRRLGDAYESLGEYENAIDAFRQALRISRRLKNMGNESRYMCSLANVYLSAENRPTSADIVRDRVGNGTVDEAMKFNRNWGRNLGEIKALTGKPRNTIELLFHAQDLAEDSNNDENKERVLRSLGDLYNLAGKYYYVLNYYKRALELSKKIGDIGGQVQLLCSLGDACSEIGEMSEAIEYYKTASAAVKETGYKKYESASLYGLGRIERLNGKLVESSVLMEQALSIAQQMKDRKREILCLIELGIIHTANGNYLEAINILKKALDIIHQTGNKEFVSECNGRIGIPYELMGDYANAGVYYQTALSISREVGNLSQEAFWLSYHGYNYQHLPDGNNITAVELTEWALEIAQKTQNEQLKRMCAEKYNKALGEKP